MTHTCIFMYRPVALPPRTFTPPIMSSKERAWVVGLAGWMVLYSRAVQETNANIAELRRQGFDYFIRSYSSERMVPQTLMMETTHRGDFSRDMELAAIAACGRWAWILDLRNGFVSTATPSPLRTVDN